MTTKNKEYWIARLREHLADFANARDYCERERIMRRIGFASRKVESFQ